MDSWPQDHRHGHKRTYNEMAQHATLSPSPFFFGAAPHSPSPLIDNTPIFVERRRTSHPHNQQYHQPSLSSFFSPARDIMSDRQHSSHRPSLIHQTSQTVPQNVIDLTEDAEEADQDLVNARLLQRYSRRPPQLGRSDGSSFHEHVIDLTEDLAEDDLEITGAREIQRQRSPPVHRRRPRLLHTVRERILDVGRNDGPFGFFARNPPEDDADQHHHPLAFMEPRRPGGFFGEEHREDIAMMVDQLRQHHRHHQQMPGILDYGLNAFHVRAPPPPPKPAHEPPRPARPGFTRSPVEEDMIICPGCEEELVAKKAGEDDKPPSKKSSKPPSKKDREEHPFWVVKECGHVYCNKCFQHRKFDRKTQPKPIFPEITKESSKSKSKVSVCIVDGCESEVTSKERWVGVFI